MADEEHALLSPSGASRWMVCAGSVVLSAGLPDVESEFAAEGTFAHAVAAHCLLNKLDAKNVLVVEYKGKQKPVSMEMVEYVQDYLDYVWERAAGQNLLVEQRLEIDWLTGEKGAKGTADAVILSDNGEYADICDLKYGMGVKVDAEENEQLQIYALAALEQFEMLGDFKKVKLHIHQPRLEHYDEWEVSVPDLREFEVKVRKAVKRVREAQKSNSLDGYLNPGAKQCRFCKARATCPALASQIAEATGADFNDVSQTELIDPIDLGAAMDKADLVEVWMKGVRARVEAELLNGQKVKGWKLVEGKKGNRDWSDDATAEAEMKAMRLTQEKMYSFKLLSPTKMEKVLKENPKSWSRITKLISRKAGKPSVAKSTDPRPVYDSKPSEDFGTVETVEVVETKETVLIQEMPEFLKRRK